MPGNAVTIRWAAAEIRSGVASGANGPFSHSSEVFHSSWHNAFNHRSTLSALEGTHWRLLRGRGPDPVGRNNETTELTCSSWKRVYSPASYRHQSQSCEGLVNSNKRRWLHPRASRISLFQSAPAWMLTPETKHSTSELRLPNASATLTANALSCELWLTEDTELVVRNASDLTPPTLPVGPSTSLPLDRPCGQ